MATPILPTADIQVKTSAETCELFVAAYYAALNTNAPIAPYYVNISKTYSTASPPQTADISINGQRFTTPADYEKAVKEQTSKSTNYHVESFDCHVISPSFTLATPDWAKDVSNNAQQQQDIKNGHRMSIYLTVTGRFDAGDRKQQTSFHETFLLAPNWEALKPGAAKGMRRVLIQSQNFRALSG